MREHLKQSRMMLGFVTVMGCLLLSGCTSLMHPSSDAVGIRVYADRGTTLPDGGKGGAVQVYGVRAGRRGLDVEVWKLFAFKFDGLIFDHWYELASHDERTYIFFPTRKGSYTPQPEGILEFDHGSGKLYGRIDPGRTQFVELRENLKWEAHRISARPPIPAGVQGVQTSAVSE